MRQYEEVGNKMDLDSKTQAIIAIGASTAANCTGCLEETVSIAKRLGIQEEEIKAAIDVGRRVRAGAAAKLDRFTTTVSSATADSSKAKNERCVLHRIKEPSESS